MTVFRCDWCGRFYSSPLPEGSACQNHVAEHNERLRRDIERFNQRLALRGDREAEAVASTTRVSE